ncbi:hypothetical protein I603_2253 [Erythrobacter dokdonensis DSW-74]|uniref:Uncharacterized protein n=1 Tax=Erythrobacter dokdonensis DSW-74 TaxID=1300349 RepID=A0A1A7BEW1_9SPHN|nr:hypothetical protein I603_2253 [Erythrobacter dokdonensis DSW-74]
MIADVGKTAASLRGPRGNCKMMQACIMPGPPCGKSRRRG